MTNQHTPAPWRYEADFKEVQAGPLSEYKILAQVSPENRAGDFIDDDETAANGRLISAAPELLHAVHLALVFLTDHHEAAALPIVMRLRAALRLAEVTA